MTAPRVWVGPYTSRVAYWHPSKYGWSFSQYGPTTYLSPGVLFVPGDQSKPTMDVREIKYPETCKVVDWK